MSKHVPLLLIVLCLLLPARPAVAQSDDEGWRISIYPVLAWIPTGIDIDLNVPPSDDVDGGFIGQIVESRFDGAYLGGFSAAKGGWRMDVDGLWAAVGGDRVQLPRFTVDADLIYFHAVAGPRIVKDLYATGGVRRIAVKYVIEVDALGRFERKPGVWDPIVGLGWHTQRPHWEVHAIFEGGGFGVGSDVELSTSFRADWKPIPHFGVTAGYQFLYFKIEDTRRDRLLEVKQTLQGPIVGIGFYF